MKISRLFAAFWILFGGVAGACADEPVAADLQRWLGPQDWKRDTDGPILSLGEAGEFDDRHIHAPCVVRFRQKYWMYYTGSSGTVADRVFKLGLANSRDGRTFERSSEWSPAAFDDENRSILTPTVLTDVDGRWPDDTRVFRMWCSVTDFHDPKQRHTLHELHGDNPLEWRVNREPLIENCYAPTIIKDGDEYLLWYTDVAQDPWCIRHARSRDGTTWEIDPASVLQIEQAWESGRLFYPTVRKVDGTFLMWYGSYWREHPGKTALGFAVSRDGRKWIRSPHNPVFRPDPARSWESHCTTSQSVMRLDDGSWRIWYASRPKPPFEHKYFAICTAIWSGPPALK